VQEPVVPFATKVQVTAVPEVGVAVKVTVAPEVKPPIFIVGVLSFVILSVLELPVSDPESRVGAAGAAIPPKIIVRVKAGKVGVSPFPPNSNIPHRVPGALVTVLIDLLSFQAPEELTSITEYAGLFPFGSPAFHAVYEIAVPASPVGAFGTYLKVHEL
jgi:hypothetical protein